MVPIETRRAVIRADRAIGRVRERIAVPNETAPRHRDVQLAPHLNDDLNHARARDVAQAVELHLTLAIVRELVNHHLAHNGRPLPSDLHLHVLHMDVNEQAVLAVVWPHEPSLVHEERRAL